MNLIKLLPLRYFNSAFIVHFHKVSISTAASELHGRDLVSFENHTSSDIKTLIWAALDLKERKLEGRICNGKSVCMVSDDPIRRISLANAAIRLGASVTFLSSSELSPDHLNFETLGKSLASASDIVFLDSKTFNQENAETLANGCTVPVATVQTSELSPVVCLSEVMTLFEHYQFLQRLIISYVGIGFNPILNTYALLLPKLGMNLHFLIEGEMNSQIWEKGVGLSIQSNTEFKQFDNLADNIFRTHVISTCSHTLDGLRMTLKNTEEMDLNWTLLHSEVYKGHTMPEEMLRCKQSLIWKTITNLTWIFQAVIACTTIGYKPVNQRPGFEGNP